MSNFKKTEKEFYELKAQNLLRLFTIPSDTKEEYDAQVTLMVFNLKEIVEEAQKRITKI